jgi:hypothetical protein
MKNHTRLITLAGLVAASSHANAQVIVVGYSVFGVPISPWLSAVLAVLLAGSSWWLMKRRPTGGFFVAALALLVAGFGAYTADVNALTRGYSITGNSPFDTGEIGLSTNCGEGPVTYGIPFENGMPYGITISSISVSPNLTWQLVNDSAYCQVGQTLGANGGSCAVGIRLLCVVT